MASLSPGCCDNTIIVFQVVTAAFDSVSHGTLDQTNALLIYRGAFSLLTILRAARLEGAVVRRHCGALLGCLLALCIRMTTLRVQIVDALRNE
jgi:hypothetical protein